LNKLASPGSYIIHITHRCQITYLDEYYLTNAEIDVLTRSANEIAQNIQSESMVIELGSGFVHQPQLWQEIHSLTRELMAETCGK